MASSPRGSSGLSAEVFRAVVDGSPGCRELYEAYMRRSDEADLLRMQLHLAEMHIRTLECVAAPCVSPKLLSELCYTRYSRRLLGDFQQPGGGGAAAADVQMADREVRAVGLDEPHAAR